MLEKECTLKPWAMKHKITPDMSQSDHVVWKGSGFRFKLPRKLITWLYIGSVPFFRAHPFARPFFTILVILISAA